MKLNGVVILNIDGLRDNFDIAELWNNIEIGTFQAFEQSLAQKKVPLTQEIIQALTYQGNGGEELTSLLNKGKLDSDALTKCLAPFHTYSLLSDQSDFVSRNEQRLAELSLPLRDACTEQQAAKLYLFLLIHLQAFPKEVIPPKSIQFFIKNVLTHKTSASAEVDAHPDRISENPTNPKESESCLFVPRLGFRDSEAIYLERGRLLSFPSKQPIFASQEKILSFAHTTALGILAVTADGRLSTGTRSDIRNRVPDQETIVMVSAYGESYMLLTTSGGIITNITMQNEKEWKDLCWISVGLNSAVGIKRKFRSVVQIGSDPVLTNNSDVETLYTHSVDGKKHFALLRTDGTLLMDDGASVSGVLAANLSKTGYEYAVSDCVCVRNYQSSPADVQTTQLPAHFRASEIQSSPTRLICGCFANSDQTQLFLMDKH